MPIPFLLIPEKVSVLLLADADSVVGALSSAEVVLVDAALVSLAAVVFDAEPSSFPAEVVLACVSEAFWELEVAVVDAFEASALLLPLLLLDVGDVEDEVESLEFDAVESLLR